MGRKPERRRIAVAVVMVLAYLVYAVSVIRMSQMVSAQDTDAIVQIQEELIQKQMYAQFGAESVLCLTFLMESWYVWFQSKQLKLFALEMGYGILLTAFLGAVGTLAGWIFVPTVTVSFFDPLFMTVEITSVDLILAVTVLRDRKRKQ